MDAVIYLRVSTKEQAAKDETSEGYSIPAQREACLRHIAEHGWNVAGELTDAGESARTADRPMLKAPSPPGGRGRDRRGRRPQDRSPRPFHGGPRGHQSGVPPRGGAAGLGDREHRGDGLWEARGGHPRAHGRVLLGQPGRRDPKGHDPKSQDGWLAEPGAHRLLQRPREDRRQGRVQGAVRPRAGEPGSGGIPALRDRRVLDSRTAGDHAREGPHVAFRQEVRSGDVGLQARRDAGESVLPRRRGVGRRSVRGPAQTPRLAESLRPCPGRPSGPRQGGSSSPAP
jgi:hypothetical protein